jgi:Tfp pilus assembly protein PilF
MSTRMELIKRYLHEDPSDSFLRYALALEYMALEDNVNAYEQLTRLLNEDPDYLPAYYMSGKAAESLGNFSEAVKWYRTGIEVAKLQGDLHTKGELESALLLIED